MRRIFGIVLLILVVAVKPVPVPASPSLIELERGLTALRKLDYQVAYDLLYPLAEKNEREAQFLLGVLLSLEDNPNLDLKKSRFWYEKAARGGHGKAQNNLGVMFDRGLGGRQDFSEAAKWFQEGAKKDIADAQNNLGMLFEAGLGVEQNFHQAARWFQRAQRRGSDDAAFRLGYLYQTGVGVPQDFRKAKIFYTKAALAGNSDAQYNLGMFYAQGLGIDKDTPMAIYWLGEAAKQGQVEAQNNLALIHLTEPGNPGSEEKAERLFSSAARSGNPQAQLNLALFQINSAQSDQKAAEAVSWLKRAAKSGYAQAQRHLGLAFKEGIGVTKNYPAALAWFKIALMNGDENSRMFISLFETSMTEQAKEEVRTAALNCVSKSYQSCNLEELTNVEEVTVNEIPLRRSPQAAVGSGTGIFVSSEFHILTNYHVVSSCSEIFAGQSPGEHNKVRILKFDTFNDLALLEIKPEQKIDKVPMDPHWRIPTFRQKDPELGEEVLVAGFPFGTLFNENLKVSKGVVSATRGALGEDEIFQLDAAVQTGNSGGPVFDQNGNILGMIVAQLDKVRIAELTGSLPENMNYSIKSSTLVNFLKASGVVTSTFDNKESLSSKRVALVAGDYTAFVTCNSIY